MKKNKTDEKKIFKIVINADAKKVWFSLWDDSHYRKWTSVFCEGSYLVTDHWKEGSKVHFLTPEGKGMYSIVAEYKPYEKMFFTHIGNVDNFQELPLDDEVKQWTGATENYTLTETDGKTTWKVEIDLEEKSADYFDKTFPVALEKVKQLAEDLFITV